jgi:chromosome segregation ATPase
MSPEWTARPSRRYTRLPVDFRSRYPPDLVHPALAGLRGREGEALVLLDAEALVQLEDAVSRGITRAFANRRGEERQEAGDEHHEGGEEKPQAAEIGPALEALGGQLEQIEHEILGERLARVEDHELVLDALLSSVASVGAAVSSLAATVGELRGDVRELRGAVGELREGLDEVHERMSAAGDVLSEVRDAMSVMRERDARVESLAAEVASVRGDVAGVESLAGEVAAVRGEVAAVRGELASTHELLEAPVQVVMQRTLPNRGASDLFVATGETPPV